MDVSTLYVGQGALSIVRHQGEAIIVDSFFKGLGAQSKLLALQRHIQTLVKGHSVGLLLTGFDADHCCPDGVAFILKNVSPAWVMYPTYYKDSAAAADVFRQIRKHETDAKRTGGGFDLRSVRVDKVEHRNITDLLRNMHFELFSPHIRDMDSSNNSSIVVKVYGSGPDGFTYLVTGDTETDRWETIAEIFGSAIESDVMAAAHHGANSGMHAKSLLLINPNTVLISAGHENQYGHPDSQAVSAYRKVAKHVFSTHADGGVSLFTKRNGSEFETKLFR